MNKTTSGFAPYGRQTHTGFTIVELLIVIVVIAILAAISVAAYTGIQNRANDTAIQSDLNNFAKKIQIAAATTGEFPAGGGAQPSSGVDTGDSTTFPGFTFSPSKSSYRTQESNLFYCTGTETSSGQKIFQLRARSKSGNTFVYTSSSGLQNAGNVAVGWFSEVCDGIGYPRTVSYGFYIDTPEWWSWTNG